MCLACFLEFILALNAPNLLGLAVTIGYVGIVTGTLGYAGTLWYVGLVTGTLGYAGTLGYVGTVTGTVGYSAFLEIGLSAATTPNSRIRKQPTIFIIVVRVVVFV